MSPKPDGLAIRIDEDTAIVIDNQERCTVIGSRAVYVADGRSVPDTNMSEHAKGSTLCLFDDAARPQSAHQF